MRRVNAWQTKYIEKAIYSFHCALRDRSACQLSLARIVCLALCGEVPEWSNGAVSKTVERANVPRVRIPVSPPVFSKHQQLQQTTMSTQVGIVVCSIKLFHKQALSEKNSLSTDSRFCNLPECKIFVVILKLHLRSSAWLDDVCPVSVTSEKRRRPVLHERGIDTTYMTSA